MHDMAFTAWNRGTTRNQTQVCTMFWLRWRHFDDVLPYNWKSTVLASITMNVSYNHMRLASHLWSQQMNTWEMKIQVWRNDLIAQVIFRTYHSICPISHSPWGLDMFIGFVHWYYAYGPGVLHCLTDIVAMRAKQQDECCWIYCFVCIF